MTRPRRTSRGWTLFAPVVLALGVSCGGASAGGGGGYGSGGVGNEGGSTGQGGSGAPDQVISVLQNGQWCVTSDSDHPAGDPTHFFDLSPTSTNSSNVPAAPFHGSEFSSSGGGPLDGAYSHGHIRFTVHRANGDAEFVGTIQKLAGVITLRLYSEGDVLTLRNPPGGIIRPCQ